MTTLARLSLWVPTTQLDAFEAVFERQLAPILQQHGLVESSEPGRTTEVFSRLFVFDRPGQIAAAEQALAQDAAWQQVLGELGARFGMTGEDRSLRYSLRIYATSAGPGRTVEAGAGIQQGLWQSFGIKEGLASAFVFDILQDRAGRLWLATLNGVIRYDGALFTSFTSEDGLADNTVEAIVEDREGHLWFGTGGFNNEGRGVSRYDGQAFVTFTTEDGLADNTVTAIAEDRDGHLWFGTGGGIAQIEGRGVSRYDGQAFTTFTTQDGLAGNTVLAICQDRKGYLWFGTREPEGGGVSRYDGQAFVTFTTEDGLADNTVMAIAEDRDGHLWFGTGWFSGESRGVSRYDGQAFVTFTSEDGLADNTVTAIAEDRDGHLWFGTIAGGLSRFDGQAFITFTVQDGLANNRVQAIFQDRQGNLWVGTQSSRSLCRYVGTQFATFTVQDGLANNGVMSILEDKVGGLWFGTWSGVSRYDGAHVTTPKGLPANVWSIAEDRKGHLWFGVFGRNLMRYDGEEVTAFTKADGLASNEVICCFKDREDYLWIGTFGGVSRFDGEAFVNFTTQDGLAPSRVQAIFQDRAGHLWFGTRAGGLSRFDGQAFVRFTTQDGLANNRVNAIFEDRQGYLWIGTFGGGVSRYDGNAFTNFTVEDGLGDNHVLCILEDLQGHLWFGTFGGGISRYDGRVFQSLSRRDGLAHDAVQAFLQDRHGAFWIGTEGGVTRYQTHDTPPTIHLTNVSADRRYGAVREVQLPTSQQLVVFEFRGSNFTMGPEGMAYVYRLQGYDADWRVAYEGRAEYQDLPLGDYTFEVKAVDRDLNYSQPVEVQLSVVPDPHRQALAEVLSVGVGGEEFVGHSPALRRVQEQLRQVAPAELTVLILGETGTGKGLAARTLHQLSPNRAAPFIQVNCGALPEPLIESELFGHEKGAFTGAASRRLGKVELASGGTLFLDEIGDMPLGAQIKLLRLLEERTFERVGGEKELKAQVRIVAATNRDLRHQVQAGTFREDLYFRLQGFEVQLPPLRDRRDDIPLLALYFIGPKAAHLNKAVTGLSPAAEAALAKHAWPGNVRELQHAIERAVVVCQGPVIQVEDLGLATWVGQPAQALEPVTLEEFERRYILQILEEKAWRISGPKGAAAVLGLHEATLRSRLKKLGISRVS